MFQFLMGTMVAVGVAGLAFKLRSLNRGGAITAAVLGTVVFGLAGGGWALVMLTFFISSSGLSKLLSPRKNAVEMEFAKGGNRDPWQVLANGGLAGTLALAYFFLSKVQLGSGLLPILWVGFASSLAGANADTWGTELGAFNPRMPVLITSFKRVPRGTSGAVSPVGTLAAVAGSALVASVAVIVGSQGWAPGFGLPVGLALVAITLGGFAGALIDSLLGATIQAQYVCPTCQKETEKHPLHTCGTPTVRVRGLPWLNNDVVNFLCTLSAGVIGIILFLVLQ